MLDEAKLGNFMGKVLGDLGAAMSVPLIRMGEQLGYWRTMAKSGPITSTQLARKTKTGERYAREWLASQAAGGYVEYDAAAGTYTLPPEHAAALADEDSPFFVLGGFEVVESVFRDAPKIARAFRSGRGVGWGDHDPALFRGTERFFGPGYRANLVQSWLPALDGVVDKLKKGARVADVGCGHGISTLVMAKAFPKSSFTGFELHGPSVREARKRARASRAGRNLRFAVAAAAEFPGEGWDLVTFFDCLHDMGDPLAVAKHVRAGLAPDGTWMVVEPFAGDRVEENLTPVGRCFYAASTQICVPASIAQRGPGLGAQAGEARISEFIRAAGFTRIRRATQTPFNLILEARP